MFNVKHVVVIGGGAIGVSFVHQLVEEADYLRRSANFASALATFGATTNWQ